MTDPLSKNPPHGPATAAPPVTGGPPAAPSARFRQRGFGAGFTQVPNVVLKSRRLSPTAKVAYAVLCSFAWQEDHAWPHQTALAAEVNVQDRVLRRALRELRLLGLLTVERRGQGATNVYWLEAIEPFAEEEQEWLGTPAPPAVTPAVTDGSTAADDRTISTVQDQSQTSALDRSQTSAPLLRKKKTQGKEDSQQQQAAPDDDPAVVVVASLTRVGFPRAAARRLVERHGVELCARQLELLPLWKPRDPAATLRRAIEEKWLPPDGNPKLRLPGERPYTPLAPPVHLDALLAEHGLVATGASHER